MANSLNVAKSKSTFRAVGELLWEYRARHPAKPAIVDVDQGKVITFGELAEVVDTLAIQLARRGARRGSRVILLADNGIEKILLWLAIWRAGAAVCPIDVTFIGSAASSTLRAIGPDLIIVAGDGDPPAVFSDVAAGVLRFPSWQPEIAGGSGADDELCFSTAADEEQIQKLPSAAIDDIASMTCTSGTTSLPKIILYDHAALWENGQVAIDFLGLTGRDRTLEYRSLGWYSPQILSLMPFLQTGLTLHVAHRFSISRLPDWIEQYRITMCAGVPTVINMLLHQPVARAAERFSCLRIMTCSSAPLSTAQWLRFEEIYGVRLLNLYGSSEMGWICANRHDRRKIGTVGPVVESVELRVVDDSGIACAPGVEGQIIVNAAKAAVGHLRDDGSVEALRGKPLKTRDLGFMDQEGYMRLMGRTDDLIIRGGVKISPLEIEEALAAHDGVLEAVVVGLPDPIYGQQPVGFIVPKSGIRLDEAAILEHCANSLAREKVPKRVYIVDALPRSARGKLLRIKLRSDYRTALQNQ